MRIRNTVGIPLAALFAGVLSASTSAAAEAPNAAPAVLIVMDGSGSMKRTDASGTPLVEAAKRSVRDLVETLPSQARVGLRVYGTEVASEDKAAGCRDSRLVAPVAPLDKPRLLAAVEDIKAVGFTPIGYALQQAAKDLPAGGKRTIVLVSDGEDTCTPPDPCKVARDLRAGGIDVTIETLGLKLENEKSRRQLECIAKATGGSYRDVSTAEELGMQLQAVTSRAIRTAKVDGQPVEGQPNPAEAPVIQPGASYIDTIVLGEKLHYGFDLAAGQAVKARITSPGVEGATGRRTLRAEFVSPDGNTNTDESFPYNFKPPREVISGAVTSETAQSDNAGRWTLAIEGVDSYNSSAKEFPLQIQIEVVNAGDGSATPTAAAQASPSDIAAGPVAAESGGVPGWLYAVLALMAVVIVALVVAVAVLMRRNTGSATRP